VGILQFANTQLIFITAMVQPNEIAYYKEIVAMDVIAKLFNPMTLASAAQDIWEHCHA
jgi:two-component system OmpR family response regulator